VLISLDAFPLWEPGVPASFATQDQHRINKSRVSGTKDASRENTRVSRLNPAIEILTALTELHIYTDDLGIAVGAQIVKESAW
jgi:hypothetical protein